MKRNQHSYKTWWVGAISGTLATLVQTGQVNAAISSLTDTSATTNQAFFLAQDALLTPTEELTPVPDAELVPNAPVTAVCDESGICSETSTEPLPAPACDPAQGCLNPETPGTPATLTILAPTPGTILDIPSSTVIVQYRMDATLTLKVNGETVDRSLIGRTEKDERNQVITETWYGVTFKAGENTLTAQTSVNGETEPIVSVQVVVRDAPKSMRIETVESRIPADGRSTATLQGQLLDQYGNHSNYTAVVTLNTSAGQFVGADFKPDQPGFQVEAKEGQFSATLQADTKAQTVRIQAVTIGELEAFTQLQLTTALRSNLTTGVVNLRWGARGTDYYGSLRDFLPPDGDNSNQLDIDGAAFTTGHIGDWLFTGAFNSDRSINQDCNCDNRLFRAYQPSEFNYPIYGDSSTHEYTTPSTDSFYLRLEHSTTIPNADPDYFMWGDYNTSEFATESQQFSAITRQLHGFKGNYNVGNLQLSAFYGNNVEGFQRDTLVPDGTSGYYFLSQRPLVPGSENVFIEWEELNRPGLVVKREQLSRISDYRIDYDRGTLFFNEPILRTAVNDQGDILVRRIVATYQYENQGEDSNIVGGRVRYHFSREFQQESSIGASYIREDQGVRNFELYGADALVSFGENAHLIAEYAHSSNHSEFLGPVSGSAYRVEAEAKVGDRIQTSAYYRSADTGFSNNATVSFVPGQTRYGAQVGGKVTPTTTLRVQYDHEDNEGIAPRPLTTFEDLFDPRLEAVPGSAVDNSLTTVTAGIQQKLGIADLALDWIYRDRQDNLAPNNLSGTSQQLRSRLTVPLTDTLTLRAQNEFTLSNDTDAVFGDRTFVGLDWQLYPGINLNLAQNWFTSGQFAGQAITSVGINGEYHLGRDTTLTGRYALLGGENGMNGQGALGINHNWAISPGLRLNLAYEHVFGNFFGQTAAGTQFPQPFAFGQSAYGLGFNSGNSYSVGLEYTDNPNFKASGRYEHRSSSSGSNTVITAGAAGRISPAITALFDYRQASAANQKLQGLGTTVNLKLGAAYRDPSNDQFNALLHYEYRKNPSTIPDTLLFGSGTGSDEHLFAAEAIYAPNWQWEFYGKYAFRSSTTYLAEDLIGSSNVSLAQLRATYRLGYQFDLVGEARWISQPSADYSETGFLVEAGYYLTPDLRFSAGYAFGSVDDADFNGSRSAGGPYLGLTLKLNGLLNGFNQQLSTP